MIGLPSQMLGNALCLYINGLNVDVTAEIELKDIGAESKVALLTLNLLFYFYCPYTSRNKGFVSVLKV